MKLFPFNLLVNNKTTLQTYFKMFLIKGDEPCYYIMNVKEIDPFYTLINFTMTNLLVSYLFDMLQHNTCHNAVLSLHPNSS